MIGIFGHNEPGATGVRLCNPESQIIGLGPGAGEHRVRQGRRVRGQQCLGVIEHAIMQIPGVAGKYCRLLRRGRNYIRVAMAHRGHVVIGIQIGIAVLVVEPDTLPSHQMHGRFIKQPVGGAQRPCPPFNQHKIIG